MENIVTKSTQKSKANLKGKRYSGQTVLFTGNTAWSMWNFRKEVMEHFSALGARVVVAAPSDSYSPKLASNFEYIELKYLQRKSTNPLDDVLLFSEIVSLYRIVDPCMIFQYTIKSNIYGNLAARLLGMSTVSIVPGAGYLFSKDTITTKFAQFMYKWSLRYTSSVVFLNNEDLIDFKQRNLLTTDKSSSRVLQGEGVDVDWFCPDKNRSFKNSGEGEFLFLGRLLIDKGVLDYLETAKKMKSINPSLQFHVAGPLDSGNPMCMSESTLNESIDSGVITYHGVKSDVRGLIKMVDAVVLPTRYREGLSRVCLESLSCGTPVVSTKNRGCTPIVRHMETGVLMESYSQESLIEAISLFVGLSKEDRCQLGVNGRSLIKRSFSMRYVIAFYKDIYEQNTIKENK